MKTLLATLLLAVTLCSALALAVPPDSAADALQVNVNTADVETLAEALTGVGRARAEAIVRFRDEHGAFKTLEDLRMVQGIGPHTLNLNRERIVFSDD